jgi:ATP/maltotriose-dependent transcriptional regulator MalT
VALTADTQPAAPPYGAAMLVDPNAVEGVTLLLRAGGFTVTEQSHSLAQVPRYTVTTVGSIARRKEELGGLLSERELQVLQGMARGMSNAAIGRLYHLSEDTIKTHARRLFRKLRVADRAHAVAIGYERGILGGA